MRRCTVTRVAAILAMGGSLLGCTGGEKDDGADTTILLGAVIDRTGNNSEPSWGDAIALAERHMNAALRRAGLGDEIEFEIDIEDSQNTPAVAVARASELVFERGAKGLLADSSQNSIALNKTHYDFDSTNDLNVPIQCSGCTAGSINNPNATHANPIEQLTLRNSERWLFRSIMSTRLISRIIVQLLLQDGVNGDVNEDGIFKIVAYHSNESFGNATANDITSFANSLGTGTVVVERLSHPGDADPDAYDWAADMELITDDQTASVTDGEPDAISFASFAQYYVPFVQQYNSLPIANRPRLINVHTFRIQSVITALGSQADGIEGVSHVLIDGTSGEGFAALYEDYYGYAPVYRDSIYYDNAVTMMLGALKAAVQVEDPSTIIGADVAEGMRTVSEPGGTLIVAGPDSLAIAVETILAGGSINYEGASGPMDYDANQNVLNRLAHYRAESGSFVDLEKYDCVADPITCPVIP